MGIGKIEPTADLRQNAILARQLYIAYIEAGFTQSEAFKLIANIMTMGVEKDDTQNSS